MKGQKFTDFTDEDFQKHLRFLTKLEVENQLNHVYQLPNLYRQSQEILNTTDLDKKHSDYVQKAQLLELIIAEKSQIFYKLLAKINRSNLENLEYSRTEPENPKPNTLYLTPDFMNIDGVQIKYSDQYLGQRGSYFYTGSIEMFSDSGVFFSESGMTLITSVSEDGETRVNKVNDLQLGVERLFKSSSRPIETEYYPLVDEVELEETASHKVYRTNPEAGKPSFYVIKFLERKFTIYGDFSFDEETGDEYCPKAVQVTFDDKKLGSGVILEKIVGEYEKNRFKNCYFFDKERDCLVYEERGKNGKIVGRVVSNANDTTKVVSIDREEYKNLNLDKIAGMREEDLEHFQIVINKANQSHEGEPDILEGNLKCFVALNYQNLELESIRLNQEQKSSSIFTLQTNSVDGELRLEELQELNSHQKTDNQSNSSAPEILQNGLILQDGGPGKQFRFEGTAINYRPNGQGSIKFPEICVFEGEFRNSQISDGTMKQLKSGDKLIGKFLGNKLNDQIGRIEYSDGSVYTGNVVNSRPHGVGELTLPAHQRAYEGEFVEGLPNGAGKTTFDSGDVYRGAHQNGMIFGKGKLDRANGDVYRGQFRQDSQNGFFILAQGRFARNGGTEPVEGVFEIDLTENGDDSDGNEGGSARDGEEGGKGAGSPSIGSEVLRLSGLGPLNSLIFSMARKQVFGSKLLLSSSENWNRSQRGENHFLSRFENGFSEMYSSPLRVAFGESGRSHKFLDPKSWKLTSSLSSKSYFSTQSAKLRGLKNQFGFRFFKGLAKRRGF